MSRDLNALRAEILERIDEVFSGLAPVDKIWWAEPREIVHTSQERLLDDLEDLLVAARVEAWRVKGPR